MEPVLVVDIEATCWRSKQETPPGQQSEIIEIGICVLEDGKRITQPRSILIKPTRSQVSAFCTELTTITPEMLEDGISFREACAILETEYDSKARVWGSWGDYDRRMFEKQCALSGVPYPFSDQHINLKKRFAALYNLDRTIGMAGALKMRGLPLEGTHHRGGDDAQNIARLLIAMLEHDPSALETL